MRHFYRLSIIIFALYFTACQEKLDPNSDPRFNGNRLMEKVLDSLNSIADPNTNDYLSGRRAAQMLEKSHNYTQPEDIINWETKYCFELLNAGNVDECIKQPPPW